MLLLSVNLKNIVKSASITILSNYVAASIFIKIEGETDLQRPFLYEIFKFILFCQTIIGILN